MKNLNISLQNISNPANHAAPPCTQPTVAAESEQVYRNIRQVMNTVAILGSALSLITLCSKTIDDFVGETLGIPLDLVVVGSLLLGCITHYRRIFTPEADYPPSQMLAHIASQQHKLLCAIKTLNTRLDEALSKFEISIPCTQPTVAPGSGRLYQNIQHAIYTVTLLGTGLLALCICSRTIDHFVHQTLGFPLHLLMGILGSLLLSFGALSQDQRGI